MVDYQFQECLTCWILLYGGLKPWLPFSVECRPLKVAAALPGSIRACPTAFTALRCRRCLNQWARSSGKLKEGIYTHTHKCHTYLFIYFQYIYYIYIEKGPKQCRNHPKSPRWTNFYLDFHFLRIFLGAFWASVSVTIEVLRRRVDELVGSTEKTQKEW
jgi:hypothetical protein